MVAALVTAGALISAGALFGAGATPPVHAAPQPARAAPAQLAAAVTETAKATLPETSIAGPGFRGFDIAWTGTDAAHHLNVGTGTDGLHFPTKTILRETSPFAPALTTLPGELPLSAVLAWTGTDANHSLNVENVSTGSKRTLHERSIAAPAIAFTFLNGTGALMLAWTGADANHSLNVLPLTFGSSGTLVPGTKTVLRQFSSNAGPSVLGAEGGASMLIVLGWSVRGTQRLNLAESTDGATFTSALGGGLPQTSATAPQFIQVLSTTTGCLAWTGTDAAHHLNVQCTTQFPQFPDPAHTKTVLPETALGAPGFTGQGPNGDEIAWTGTDPAHHLNVAQLQGTR